MFIHGSFASILRSNPVVRLSGHRSDIDVYGNQQEFDLLVAKIQEQDRLVHVCDTTNPNRSLIVRQDRRLFHLDHRSIKDIEYERLPAAILQAFAALPDNGTFNFFEQQAFFVSDATDVVIKKCVQHLNEGERYLKHEQDIAWLLSKGLVFKREHQTLANLLGSYYQAPEPIVLPQTSELPL